MPYGIDLCAEAVFDPSLVSCSGVGCTKNAHGLFGHDAITTSVSRQSEYIRHGRGRRSYSAFPDCSDLSNRLTAQIAQQEAEIKHLQAASGDDDHSLPSGNNLQKKILEKELAVTEGSAKNAWDDKSLKVQLESNTPALVESATTGIEFQPTERSLEREMGPERLGAAVEEATRGANYIINATKAMPAGALAQMTTSDTKMFNQVGDALDFATNSTIALRKLLKSIKGNSCYLIGDKPDQECWAASQVKEPWEDVDREIAMPENLPNKESSMIPSLDMAQVLATMLNNPSPLRFALDNRRKTMRRYQRDVHTNFL